MVRVTPDIAKAMLEHNTHNRKMRPYIVVRYANDMANGCWGQTYDTIKFATDGTLLDGQHRLAAVVKSGRTIDFLIAYGVAKEEQAHCDQGPKRVEGTSLTLRGVPRGITIAAMVKRVEVLRHTSTPAIGLAKNGAWCRNDGSNLSYSDILRLYEADGDRYQKWNRTAASYVSLYKGIITQTELGAILYYLTTDLGHREDTVLRFFDNLYGKRNDVQIAWQLQRKFLNGALSTPTEKTQAMIRAWNAYIVGKKTIPPARACVTEKFK